MEFKDIKFKIVECKIAQTIVIKADDSAETPICIIATPIGGWMKNKKWYNTAIRKAKLLAAAPDLLEALIHITKLAEKEAWEGEYVGTDDWFYAINPAKEAIKKATDL